MDSSLIRGVADMVNANPLQTPNFEFGSEDHQQWMEKLKAERIENELSVVRGVLDEDQLNRYRAHLEEEISL
jgi:hypothetical protein